MTPNQLTEKIIAIILEEQNGFTKSEAVFYAKDNKGSDLWNRIEQLLSDDHVDETE